MQTFSVDYQTTSVHCPSLGSFAWLPHELRHEILFHLGAGQFPFGAHHGPVPTLLEANATARGMLRGCDSLRSALYNFRDLRALIRSFYALAATSKHWYMSVRELHRAFYYVFSGHQTTLSLRSNVLIAVDPALEACIKCKRPRKALVTNWYVAAARLSMWPGLRRTFVGLQGPTETRDEDIQASLNTVPRPGRGIFPTDEYFVPPTNPIFVRYPWLHFPCALVDHKPLSLLPNTVETMQFLLEADKEVRPVEDDYLYTVRHGIKKCKHRNWAREGEQKRDLIVTILHAREQERTRETERWQSEREKERERERELERARVQEYTRSIEKYWDQRVAKRHRI